MQAEEQLRIARDHAAQADLLNMTLEEEVDSNIEMLRRKDGQIKRLITTVTVLEQKMQKIVSDGAKDAAKENVITTVASAPAQQPPAASSHTRPFAPLVVRCVPELRGTGAAGHWPPTGAGLKSPPAFAYTDDVCCSNINTKSSQRCALCGQAAGFNFENIAAGSSNAFIPGKLQKKGPGKNLRKLDAKDDDSDSFVQHKGDAAANGEWVFLCISSPLHRFHEACVPFHSWARPVEQPQSLLE